MADSKKVPLVVYTDGRRNEIGEAEITMWPGEIEIKGSVTGVMPLIDNRMFMNGISIAVDDED